MQGFNFSSLPLNLNASAIYAYGSNDPSVVATKGAKGQMYLKLPDGKLFRKNDDGISTNWSVVIDGGPSTDDKGIYYVGENADFQTIQSAINKAVLDGHSDSLKPAFIVVIPKISGDYVEDIIIPSGIHVTTSNPDAPVVRLQGQVSYVPSTNDYNKNQSSISGFYLLDNSSGGNNILYNTSEPSIFFVSNCVILRSNMASTCVSLNALYGELRLINVIITNNMDSICIEQLNGSLSFTGILGGSVVQGGNKALVKNTSNFTNLLGATFNGNSFASSNQAVIELNAGTTVFSLGGIQTTNVDANPCGFYVNTGAVLLLFNCSNLVNDNGTNRCVEGVSGGTVMFGLIYDFPATTNKVNPALTLLPVPSGLISA